MSTKWMDAMHTFVERVKEGVLSNDMTLIAEALQEFTGEELVDMAAVEDISTPPVPEQSSIEKNPEDFTMPVSEDVESNRQRLTKRKSLDLTADRENQFTDDGTIEIDEAGADLIDDTIKNPIKRTRKPAGGLINITCHVCEKVELIHPSLKKEHYRCDSCCKG